MKFIRVYTGADGNPCFETIDPVSDPVWSKGFPSTATQVRAMAAGAVMDWHPAPRRQIVIHLAGQLEIELRDGTVERFGPGDARLMDDTTGAGHLTRVVGPEQVVQAVIALS